MKCGENCNCSNHKYCARKISLFDSLSEEELEKVVGLITKYKYEKGETVFIEGEVFDKLFIIDKGSIKVYKNTIEGKEQILYLLKEGEFIGDLNLLKRDIFSFSIAALEETKICSIAKVDFDNLIRINPEISIKLLEYAHDRIAKLEDLVQTLNTKDVEVRLATLLSSLAKTFGVKTKKGIEITLPVTREEMASFIGVTRETISRKLSKFQEDGVIEIVQNKIILRVGDCHLSQIQLGISQYL